MFRTGPNSCSELVFRVPGFRHNFRVSNLSIRNTKHETRNTKHETAKRKSDGLGTKRNQHRIDPKRIMLRIANEAKSQIEPLAGHKIRLSGFGFGQVSASRLTGFSVRCPVRSGPSLSLVHSIHSFQLFQLITTHLFD